MEIRRYGGHLCFLAVDQDVLKRIKFIERKGVGVGKWREQRASGEPG